jgi:hypothetical protein
LTTITEEIGLLGVTQRNMELYPGGKQRDQTGVFAFFFGLGLIGIGVLFCLSSSGRQLALSSASSVYLPFSFSFSLPFFLSFVGFFFCILLARYQACMDAQVGSAFQVPSIFVCSLLSSSSSSSSRDHRDRFFRSHSDQINQSINQSIKGKKVQNNVCFRF